MRLFNQQDIENALPMSDAIALMGEAFVAISDASVQSTERQVLEISSGHALLMAASKAGLGLASKLVTVIPGNAKTGLPVSSGLALLLNEEDGQAQALFDATALTTWRTAAAVGFATELLAKQHARTGLLVGCGTQARAQLLAMQTARPLSEIWVTARDAGRVQQFIDRMRNEVSVKLNAVEDLSFATQSADLITCVTSSERPVIDGQDVRAGCHVNAVGSFRPGMRELDLNLIGKSSVFVESRETALAEAGELIAARDAGVSETSQWREISEVVVNQVSGRQQDAERTIFKSVGHAVFDLLAAAAINRQAKIKNLGTQWQF